MGAVFTIAWRDMRSTLVSPKGGAVFFFFFLTLGLFFGNFVGRYVELQQQSPMMGGTVPALDELMRAVFYNAHFMLLFVIPALTMSSFAEEKKSHVFKLLQTAPVSASQIVFGKFLAVAGMMALLLAGTLVYPLFLMKYGEPDVGVILSSYAGMLLLVCSWLAFGLWVSALVSNVFISFVFTMMGLLLLMILNWLADSIASGGNMESILKYTASTDHLDVFFKGMISVADVGYFLCFIALFLFFTNIVLDSQRWR